MSSLFIKKLDKYLVNGLKCQVFDAENLTNAVLVLYFDYFHEVVKASDFYNVANCVSKFNPNFAFGCLLLT